MCVLCDTKHSGITIGRHKDTHALVQCQSLCTPMDAESEHALELQEHICSLEMKLASIKEQLQHFYDFISYPWHTVHAFGARIIVFLQGFVHS